jgi:hypothetical protein
MTMRRKREKLMKNIARFVVLAGMLSVLRYLHRGGEMHDVGCAR